MSTVQWLRIVGLIVVGVLLILLVLGNRQTTPVHLIVWNPEIPVNILVPGLLVVGFLAGYLTKAALTPWRRAAHAGAARSLPPEEQE